MGYPHSLAYTQRAFSISQLWSCGAENRRWLRRGVTLNRGWAPARASLKELLKHNRIGEAPRGQRGGGARLAAVLTSRRRLPGGRTGGVIGWTAREGETIGPWHCPQAVRAGIPTFRNRPFELWIASTAAPFPV
jgi:hypothetical protein